MKILNIYFGTRGLSGLYVKEVVRVQKEVFDKVYSVLSFHSLYKYGNSLVYLISDSNFASFLPSKIRLVIRYIELITSMIFSVVIIIICRPNFVNYSITMYRFEELIFLKLLKKFNIKLIITIHDAVLHQNKNISSNYRRRNRHKILCISDYALVHNSFSESEVLKINKEVKIINHPFPCSRIPLSIKKDHLKDVRLDDYLFIGHARNEKGINFLLETWSLKLFVNNRLKISGSDPFGILNKFSQKNKNILIKPFYISDNEFVKELCGNKFIVLPYTEGTNSQIPFLALSCGCIPLMSDVPAFNYFSQSTKLTFKSEDKLDFEKLVEITSYASVNPTSILSLYNEYYSKHTIIAYKKILI
jgi:hypothetical protein